MKPAAIVFGAGAQAGLGTAPARRFAREGLTTYVAGRTEQRLNTLTAELEATGAIVHPVVADATSEDQVMRLFERVAREDGDVELVAYNVGNNAMIPLLDLDVETFSSLWQQNALGGFLVGREAVRSMLPRGRGSILFTGATASLRARPPFTAFASAKAALRAVAQGMAREFGPQGIHIAHVVIDGVIAGEYARNRFPEFVAAKGADGLLEPDAIADAYWALHRQPRGAWTHELDLRPFKEPF